MDILGLNPVLTQTHSPFAPQFASSGAALNRLGVTSPSVDPHPAHWNQLLLHFAQLLLGLMGGSAQQQQQSQTQPQPPAKDPGVDKGQVMDILKKHPPTNDGMKAALPELQKAFPGVKILDHPKRLDKLQFANGAVVDVVVGAGGDKPSWGWMPEA